MKNSKTKSTESTLVSKTHMSHFDHIKQFLPQIFQLNISTLPTFFIIHKKSRFHIHFAFSETYKLQKREMKHKVQSVVRKNKRKV